MNELTTKLIDCMIEFLLFESLHGSYIPNLYPFSLDIVRKDVVELT